MSNKQFNNSHGTTSSEFSIGVGATNVRHIVLSANCTTGDTTAKDRKNEEITVSGVEFFDLKMLAKDNAGNVATKQLRGTVAVGGSVNSIEEVFQEASGANVTLSLNGNTLRITCAKGTASSIAYSIYISLLKAS
jgi:hypothetical protein